MYAQIVVYALRQLKKAQKKKHLQTGTPDLRRRLVGAGSAHITLVRVGKMGLESVKDSAL